MLFRSVEGVAAIYLTDKDVVRNPLVMRIVRAYDGDSARSKDDKDKHE